MHLGAFCGCRVQSSVRRSPYLVPTAGSPGMRIRRHNLARVSHASPCMHMLCNSCSCQGGAPSISNPPACSFPLPAHSACTLWPPPSPSCHLARVDPVQRLAPRGRRPQVRRPVLPGLFILCARILCLGGCGRLPGQPALCSEVRHRPLMLGRSSLGHGPFSSCSQRTRHCCGWVADAARTTRCACASVRACRQDHQDNPDP